MLIERAIEQIRVFRIPGYRPTRLGFYYMPCYELGYIRFSHPEYGDVGLDSEYAREFEETYSERIYEPLWSPAKARILTAFLKVPALPPLSPQSRGSSSTSSRTSFESS